MIRASVGTLVVFALAACGRPSDEQAAYATALEAVEQRLKAPATAIFPALPDDSEALDEVDVRRPPNISNKEAESFLAAFEANGRAEAERVQAAAWATDDAKHRWRVNGYVDAQNGFGALVRNRFEVVLVDGAWVASSQRFVVESAELKDW